MWTIVLAAFAGILAAVLGSIMDTSSGGHVSRTDGWDDSEEHSQRSSHSKHKKHNGKCDGDCANCPPHYGYRYGGWYYGHSHTEGCEFGGNKCDGGRD